MQRTLKLMSQLTRRRGLTTQTEMSSACRQSGVGEDWHQRELTVVGQISRCLTGQTLEYQDDNLEVDTLSC